MFAVAIFLVGLISSPIPGVAQTAFSEFDWNFISPVQQTGVPFGTTLVCRDLNGNVTTNFNGIISLAGIQRRQPTVLITEVAVGISPQAEFANLGNEPRDISEWQISIYDGSSYPAPRFTFILPTNTICPPGMTFRISDAGNFPGAFPSFQSGISWAWSTVTPIAVLLRDQNGRVIDFFCAGTGFPGPINSPSVIPLSEWIGLPVANNVSVNKTYQRVGNEDRNVSNDWAIAVSSIGALNSGLQLPFDGGYQKIPVSPNSIQFTDGVWSGNVTVTSAVPDLFLRADDLEGHSGDSNPFSVSSGSPLGLSVPSQMYEVSAGDSGVGQVSIKEPLTINLSVTLTSSRSDEIGVPASVTVFAGETNATFSITNFDDALLDGAQFSEVTASAENYMPSSKWVKNIDNEAGALTVELPAVIGENAGTQINTGKVIVSAPASGYFEIHLSSSPSNELSVPATVLLPAGQTSVVFNVTPIDDALLNGSRMASVTATVPGWMSGQTQTTLLDNENTNLILTISPNLIEGAGSVTNGGTVKIFALPATTLAISLTSSDPSTLRVPSTVFLSPGQTSAVFSVTVPDNALADGSRSVQVTASSTQLKTAQVMATVRDNDLHHFTFATIPNPQAIDRPFLVTVNATDTNGATIGNHSGSAFLRGVSSSGVITSLGTNAIQFTNGTWSGQLAISSALRGVTLICEDNDGRIGMSNPFETLGRVIPLPTSDVVYDPVSQKLYAAALNSYGTNGQSIIPVNPETGSLSPPIFLQNEPGRLAISDNGQYLYAGLNTTGGVARIHLPSGLEDLRFALGSNIFGAFFATDMEVLSEQPSALVVSMRTLQPGGEGGIAIFDNGAMRSNTIARAEGGYFLEKGTDLSSIYASAPRLIRRLSVSSSGLSTSQMTSLPAGEIKALNGRLYGTSGTVFDAATLLPIGNIAAGVLIEVVAEQAKAYVLAAAGPNWDLRIFDANTLSDLGTWRLPFITGTPNNIEYCGNGIFAISTSNELILLETDPVPSADIAVSQTVLPDPPAFGSNLVFSITVSNRGPYNVENLALTNQFVTGLEFVSASSSQGSSVYQNRLVTTTLGLMTNGGNATVTLVLAPRLPGIAVASLGAFGNLFDPNPTNNSLQNTILIPTPPTTNAITSLNLPARDLIYDPVTGKIFASVPENGGALANTLTEIDPVNLTIGPSHPIGKNPGKLAIAQNGRYIHVALDGESAIRSFDSVTGVASPAFSIGTNQQVFDLEVLSGTTHTLLVSRFITGWYDYSAAVYDNGVQRANILDSIGPIEPSNDPSRVYALLFSQYGGGFLTLAVTPSGLAITNSASLGNMYVTDFEFDDGLVYLPTSGSVFNPEAGQFLQSYPGTIWDPIVRPDSSNSKVFYLSHDINWFLQENDLASRAVLKRIQLPEVSGKPANLIRWGADGLAFCTADGSQSGPYGDQVYIIRFPELPLLETAELAVSQTVLPTNGMVGSNVVYTIVVTNQGPDSATGILVTDTLPRDAAFVSATVSQGEFTNIDGIVSFDAGELTNGGVYIATVTLIPNIAGFSTNNVGVTASQNDYFSTNNQSVLVTTNLLSSTPSLISQVSFPVTDILYDPVANRIYAGVSSEGGVLSNSLVTINPDNGEIEQSLFLGAQSGKMALSDNAQYLYLSLATGGIARVILTNQSIDLRFPLTESGSDQAGDLKVVPGQPQSLAVSVGGNVKVSIYDNGVERPSQVPTAAFGGVYPIGFSGAATVFSTYPFTLRTLSLQADGLHLASETANLVPGYDNRFEIDSGLLFFEAGRVVDPVAKTILGTYPVAGLVAPDTANSKTYFLTQAGNVWTGPLLTLRCFDQTTFSEIWALNLPSGLGSATRFIRLGTNGVAFCTDSGRLVMVRTPDLLTPSADLLLSMSGSAASVPVGGLLTYSITVRNNGPWTTTGVSVTNLLPNGFSFNSAVSSQGVCSQTNGAIVCSAGTLTNGGLVSITISVTATNLGTFTNTAFASHAATDPVTTNDTANVVTTVTVPPALAVSDIALKEGNGPGSFMIPVRLSAPSSQIVTVRYNVTDGTAIGGQDYRTNGGMSGTVTFTPASTNRGIFLSGALIGNTLVQPDRYFLVTLSNPTNAEIIKAQAQCWIVDDDFYQITALPANVTEGNSGIQEAIFSIRISPSNSQPVSVDYETVVGSASFGSDYLSRSGALSFPAGITNRSLVIPIKGDTLVEEDEQFTLKLSTPVGGTLLTNTAIGTIINDDAIPPLTILAMEHRLETFTLRFNTIEGRTYRLQRTETLQNNSWTTIGDIQGTGETLDAEFDLPAQAAYEFYRVVLLP